MKVIILVKTNAMRLLDLENIQYKIKEYTPDENNLLGLESLEQVGMTGDEVFKTLVTKGDKNGVNIFCIPLNCELDLKKAAIVSGNKKIEMAHMKDVLPLTGYVKGGCSPIGMKKKYPTYINETAILFDEIAVSAGIRGGQIVINGEILCDFVDGNLCDLTK